MATTIPTKSDWVTIKSDAHIGKAPWYKLADAAVGPALASVEAARAKWKKPDGKTLPNAVSYFNALEKLDKAFTKFVNKKDFSQAGNLAARIAGWKTEISARTSKLAALVPTLEKSWNEDGVKIINDL